MNGRAQDEEMHDSSLLSAPSAKGGDIRVEMMKNRKRRQEVVK